MTELVKVKVLAKRLLARSEDGKALPRQAGNIAFLDENTCKLHEAMGLVERVKDEPKPKKSKPKPKPKSEPEEAETGDDEPDQPDL